MVQPRLLATARMPTPFRLDSPPKSGSRVRVARRSGPSSLRLTVDPRRVFFDDHFRGQTVRIANRGDRPIQFELSGSSLFVIHEAQDRAGRWRPIEYVPASVCGEDTIDAVLAPGEQWQFAVPVYGGDFRTQLRVTLLAGGASVLASDPSQDGGARRDLHAAQMPPPSWRIHSQPFPGTIDERQFEQSDNAFDLPPASPDPAAPTGPAGPEGRSDDPTDDTTDDPTDGP